MYENTYEVLDENQENKVELLAYAGLNDADEMEDDAFFEKRVIIKNSTFGLPLIYQQQNPFGVIENIPASWDTISVKINIAFCHLSQLKNTIFDKVTIYVCPINHMYHSYG